MNWRNRLDSTSKLCIDNELTTYRLHAVVAVLIHFASRLSVSVSYYCELRFLLSTAIYCTMPTAYLSKPSPLINNNDRAIYEEKYRNCFGLYCVIHVHHTKQHVHTLFLRENIGFDLAFYVFAVFLTRNLKPFCLYEDRFRIFGILHLWRLGSHTGSTSLHSSGGG